MKHINLAAYYFILFIERALPNKQDATPEELTLQNELSIGMYCKEYMPESVALIPEFQNAIDVIISKGDSLLSAVAADCAEKTSVERNVILASLGAMHTLKTSTDSDSDSGLNTFFMCLLFKLFPIICS